MADLAYEYQDETLLDACKTLWNNMTEKRMYITGGIGSSGLLERFTTDYDLPNDRNYSESCASIGLAMFGNRMAQITKDAKYADIVEKALYNTVLAGIAMDGKSFFYVNPLEVWPDNCIERTSMEHVKPVRQKWFGVACCPPNIARTLASLGQYIYGADENSLYINLYISSQTKLLIGETETEVIMESSFLKDGTVTVHLESEKASKGTLALRIPGYTKEFTVWRGAQKIKTPLIKKGYLMITDLAASEEIKISCDMKARFVYANPKVRADEGKACIMRGPLVYCLEETDNGENLSSLYVDTKEALTENWEEQLLGGVMTVEAKGKRILEDHWTAEELYKEQPPELKDVTFGYVPGHTILKHISLYAKPGQKIAFVGSTGAGKTTITNLINRFYEIDSGEILMDGVDIRKVGRENLRSNIAMVLQDTHLFTGTIRENIRYGRLDATDAEVEQAAKMASAHSFIMRLENGYDTMIEGDGANLSQGQRQLLNIARAAISKAPVLILDEATSSVDTRTERHIEHGMDRLMAERTTLVIAHRLSTVRNANAIMVLENGEIIERGDHDQLLEQKGRYYELYTGKKQLA